MNVEKKENNSYCLNEKGQLVIKIPKDFWNKEVKNAYNIMIVKIIAQRLCTLTKEFAMLPMIFIINEIEIKIKISI
ncbi:hypothetical protein RCL_jg9593.t1 [Rhizophagus clarus]|uniref:Uncharacterized protein n=1 Tax=Rhizophagus clarus TaxID=94130 RepID=A0A8H3LUR0_9GLOM|nr:hypothetical protein RCL_jg9593.t1 [Rhizophagus clarus]